MSWLLDKIKSIFHAAGCGTNCDIHEQDTDNKTKGYIAQDLGNDFPEAYPKDPITEKYSFSPMNMVVYLMKALQEAVARIEALEAK